MIHILTGAKFNQLQNSFATLFQRLRIRKKVKLKQLITGKYHIITRLLRHLWHNGMGFMTQCTTKTHMAGKATT